MVIKEVMLTFGPFFCELHVVLFVTALSLIVCVNAGVDLSCIVKAVPTLSLADSQEEQTHEVLQVSLYLFFLKRE